MQRKPCYLVRGNWLKTGALFIVCLVLAGCVIPFTGGNAPLPTGTPVEATLPSTATMIATEVVQPTATPAADRQPTREPLQPEEPVSQPTRTPSPQPSVTATAQPEYAYQLQDGSPSYLPNVFHPESVCQWFGVAGQIFDDNGIPVQGIIVEIEGELDGQVVLNLGISGGAPQYGAGGYEVVLGDEPKSSDKTLTIVLFDTSGKQLSERTPLVTSDSCTQNLIIMNFLAESFFESEYFLPLLNKSE